VLTFENEFNADAAAKNINIDLTSASNETIKLNNNLANEGFVVRDLFVSDSVSVILERKA
jgi:hypothetical protein